MDLTIDHLGKRYGAHWALRQLSLHCEPGMLGLVGPNGAGKTTLLRMHSDMHRLLPHLSWPRTIWRVDS